MKRLLKDILIIGTVVLIIVSLGREAFPHPISIVAYGLLMFAFGYMFAEIEFKK